MGKMNEGIQSDELKIRIRDFKRRRAEGTAEMYKDIAGEAINTNRVGASKALLE